MTVKTSPDQTPRSPRSAGLLLHPTSLPGPYGIGDLGPAAYQWVDALVVAKQTWWQILPLGPTGYGDSPYQCFSALAGNPYLVSPDRLLEDGLLTRADLNAVLAGARFPAHKVDFGPVIQFKVALLTRAWEAFQAGAAAALRPEFERFCAAQAGWLDDFALFMALKDAHGGVSWLEWEAPYRRRAPAALAAAREQHRDRIGQHQFRQFLFFRQWTALKAYANRCGVKLIGDVPIFVSSDSSDVWANPELFQLDDERRPIAVAGVPPDYFSATGQLWGNPLYAWEANRRTGYAWWINRVRATLGQVDLIRIDHFRGFEAYWEIPAGKPTAEIGQWIKGPGADLFQAMEAAFGSPLPLIAEDLGIITPEVDALREQFHLPGMRVLQFAFGGATEDRFLPHNYETRNTVVYTGTHDNDTTWGWYRQITDQERDLVRRYLGRDGHDVAWDLIRLAWGSVADYAIAPLQDVLSLGPEARMNLPGSASGNWNWRLTEGQLTRATLERLADLTTLYGR
ncbi:MAG: 4-alpha-glucanotransferase [Anaerolineales bacterium]|nr:4-alpha-glucanotransferase [Anaerolineales bacterium]